MDRCIATIMYCQRLFLLFTGKHCLNFFSEDVPAMDICLHAKYKVRWCYGLVVQLFYNIKRKKEKTNNLKKHFSLYFPYVEIHLFFGGIYYFMYVLVTHNIVSPSFSMNFSICLYVILFHSYISYFYIF